MTDNLNPQQFWQSIGDAKVQGDVQKLLDDHAHLENGHHMAYQKALKKREWYGARDKADQAAHWTNVARALQIHITETDGSPVSRENVPSGLLDDYDPTTKGLRAERASETSAYRKPGRPRNEERDL